jgi:hypothetical protein
VLFYSFLPGFQSTEEPLMPLALEGQAQRVSSAQSPTLLQAEDDDLRTVHGKEDSPMSAPVMTKGNYSSNLRFWRIAVFSFIGLLYVISLFVPALREALAKIFAYFP